jgi:hypothetical protein
MCPQIIAGQGSDLTKTVAQLIKELLENNWPTSAFDPLKSDIGFGLDTWDDYGDIDIHVNADRSISEPMTIGWGRSKIMDPVSIHLFVRKNQEEIPSNMGNAQRKIEEIVKDNAAALGQGVTALRWDGWDPIVMDKSLKDIWHGVGHATAIYFKVKV